MVTLIIKIKTKVVGMDADDGHRNELIEYAKKYGEMLDALGKKPVIVLDAEVCMMASNDNRVMELVL